MADRVIRARVDGIGSRLLLPIAGVIVAPLVMAGYLALTGLIFLPLLGLRAFSRPEGDAPLHSGVRNLWSPVRRRA